MAGGDPTRHLAPSRAGGRVDPAGGGGAAGAPPAAGGRATTLERRLEVVRELLLPAGAVADIGAGPGALSVCLVERGYRVVAVESSEPGYRLLVRRLAGRAEVRLGDGFGPLLPGEVDQAVVAGLGPWTTLRILERGRAVARALRRLVLLPHRDAWPIRRALPGLGLRLVDERLVRQGRHVYQVLALEPGASPSLSDLAALLGPMNLHRPGPELRLLASQYRRRFAFMRHPPVDAATLGALEVLAHGEDGAAPT